MEVENNQRKGLFLLPRGHLKSTMITVSWVIQTILKNPNSRILITNALLDNAKGFLREVKGHLEKNEKLKALFGNLANNDDKWSEQQIIVKTRTKFHKEPTIQCTSVDKSVVSQHYDVIIADDLHNRENSTTKEQRLRVKKYYKDLLDLLEPGGILIIVGTRWHYDDLYGDLIENQVAQDKMKLMLKQARDKEGTPIFERKFTDEHLKLLKLEKGTYEYNAQYNNDPVSEEDAEFKKVWFDFFDRIAFDHSECGIYVSVDPAVSKADAADYSGFVVVAVKDGRWHVIESYRAKLNPTELVDEIFYLYGKYRDNFQKLAIEHIMYTDAIDYEITRRMRETGKWFTVQKVKHRGRKKEDRIRALIPLFERGNISIASQARELIEELEEFPSGRHDDVIDAFAYMLDVIRPGDTVSIKKQKGSKKVFHQPIFSQY